MQIGAHVSITKGFYAAYEYSKNELKGSALQLFTKSPRGGKVRALDPVDQQKSLEFQKENNFFCVAHCSYLLNFARPATPDSWANASLIDDVEKISAVGGHAVVLHIGKRLEIPENEVFKNIVENIHTVLEKTQHLNTKILLEITAGQGTEIGFRFEELGKLHQAINHPRVGICFDTCHAFAAGYDLRDEKAVQETFKAFDDIIGLEHLNLFHLNDTKKGLGSRVDRHADIGHGMIGKDGILAVARFAKSRNIPIILETPCEHEGYKEQIADIKASLE